ncbi:hypothetical protein BX600DRAFT_129819 [Xylariales sp. PMI_506]|nr:hypothetical protein BX600DRAFT_129819 [Xylariales sp. PMI_506]
MSHKTPGLGDIYVYKVLTALARVLANAKSPINRRDLSHIYSGSAATRLIQCIGFYIVPKNTRPSRMSNSTRFTVPAMSKRQLAKENKYKDMLPLPNAEGKTVGTTLARETTDGSSFAVPGIVLPRADCSTGFGCDYNPHDPNSDTPQDEHWWICRRCCRRRNAISEPSANEASAGERW